MPGNIFFYGDITASSYKVFQLKSIFEKIIILKLNVELEMFIVELKIFLIELKQLNFELKRFIFELKRFFFELKQLNIE